MFSNELIQLTKAVPSIVSSGVATAIQAITLLLPTPLPFHANDISQTQGTKYQTFNDQNSCPKTAISQVKKVFLMCSKHVSQKRNEAIDYGQWYNLLLKFIL